MKRILLVLVAVLCIAATAQAQLTTMAETVIPFRSTGLTSGTPNPLLPGTFYADTFYTKRGGAAWGATVVSQTDTTAWFSPTMFQDFAFQPIFKGGTGAADSVFVFRMFFTPDPTGVAEGLTMAADSIYVTLQGSNDGGISTSSTTYNQLVNPTSANGFSRSFFSQYNVSNPSGIGLLTFLGFRQIRFIISSDINGRYQLRCEYPKIVR